MTVFDLRFIALFLAAVVTRIAVGVSALQGRRAAHATTLDPDGRGRVLRRLVHRRPYGERQPRQDTTRFELTFRLSSARVGWRNAHGVVVYLRDARGRRYDPLPETGTIPFDTLLQPQETIEAIRRLRVPSDAEIVGVVIAREGGVPVPGCLLHHWRRGQVFISGRSFAWIDGEAARTSHIPVRLRPHVARSAHGFTLDGTAQRQRRRCRFSAAQALLSLLLPPEYGVHGCGKPSLTAATIVGCPSLPETRAGFGAHASV